MKKIITTLLATIISVSVLADCYNPIRKQWEAANDGWTMTTNENGIANGLNYHREWQIKYEYDARVKTRAPFGPCRFILTYPDCVVTQEGFTCSGTWEMGAVPFVTFEGYDDLPGIENSGCGSIIIDDQRPLLIRDHTMAVYALYYNSAYIWEVSGCDNLFVGARQLPDVDAYSKKLFDYADSNLIELDLWDMVDEFLNINTIDDMITASTEIEDELANGNTVSEYIDILQNVVDSGEYNSITGFNYGIKYMIAMLVDGSNTIYNYEAFEEYAENNKEQNTSDDEEQIMSGANTWHNTNNSWPADEPGMYDAMQDMWDGTPNWCKNDILTAGGTLGVAAGVGAVAGGIVGGTGGGALTGGIGIPVGVGAGAAAGAYGMAMSFAAPSIVGGILASVFTQYSDSQDAISGDVPNWNNNIMQSESYNKRKFDEYIVTVLEKYSPQRRE